MGAGRVEGGSQGGLGHIFSVGTVWSTSRPAWPCSEETGHPGIQRANSEDITGSSTSPAEVLCGGGSREELYSGWSNICIYQERCCRHPTGRFIQRPIRGGAAGAQDSTPPDWRQAGVGVG